MLAALSQKITVFCMIFSLKPRKSDNRPNCKKSQVLYFFPTSPYVAISFGKFKMIIFSCLVVINKALSKITNTCFKNILNFKYWREEEGEIDFSEEHK